MTVLVVEDDPDQLAIRALLLRQCGFRVLEADSYETAVAAGRTGKPACALLDLRVPDEKDGIRLLKELKAILPELVIYVLTGCPSWASIPSPELMMVDAVFRKGTSISPLLQRLKRLRTDRQEV